MRILSAGKSECTCAPVKEEYEKDEDKRKAAKEQGNALNNLFGDSIDVDSEDERKAAKEEEDAAKEQGDALNLLYSDSADSADKKTTLETAKEIASTAKEIVSAVLGVCDRRLEETMETIGEKVTWLEAQNGEAEEPGTIPGRRLTGSPCNFDGTLKVPKPSGVELSLSMGLEVCFFLWAEL